MPDKIYRKQAELLLRILPLIMREDVFALKGGTAINFFWRDYPRLSVDIDLTYIKVQERELSLLNISDHLKVITDRIERFFDGVEITKKTDQKSGLIYAMIIRLEGVTVKVEVNTVIRGSIYSCVNKTLCERGEKEFELSLNAKTLSFEDLYAGKICAALDRQHPRDLFDTMLLLANEGFTERIRKAFIVYLISHSRPIVEILNPGLKDIKIIFEQEFAGMTDQVINLNDLIDTREELIKTVKKSFTDEERKFILSFKNRNPEWNLLSLENIEYLPAVRWKLMNLEKIKPELHRKAYEKLKEYLLS